MTATNHALTGALIGLTVSNPWIALPAALLSHIICDAIPHFGLGREWLTSKAFTMYLFLDAFLCVCLVLILAFAHAPNWFVVSLCAFLATSPDLLHIRMFTALKEGTRYTPWPIDRFFSKIQWFEKPIGAAVELIWAGAAITLLWGIL